MIKKIIILVLIILVVIIGFTGAKVSIGDKKLNVPPYISNVLKSKEVKKAKKDIEKKAEEFAEENLKDERN